MNPNDFIFLGRRQNGEAFYCTRCGDLLVEKDFEILVEASCSERAEFFQTRVLMKPDLRA